MTHNRDLRRETRRDPDRRRVLLSTAGALALGLSGRAALAQSYPSRSVRFVVGFPPGGPNDILGRLVADWMSARLGQPFAVDNIGGRSGNLATEAVVRAPPDGHTILLVGPANAIGAALADDLPFDFLRDIAPVAAITREALVLLVHPSVGARSAAELIALAKAGGAPLVMASTGTGSSPHVTGELFKMMAGIELPVVHYGGGGPALAAMVAGEAQVMFEPMSAAITPVRRGQLRALAVTTTARSPALADVPPLAESVAGFEASAVTGIGVPRGTPLAIVATLNGAINAAFSDPAMAARLAETGGVGLPGTSEAFAAVLASETEKWGKVVRAALRKP